MHASAHLYSTSTNSIPNQSDCYHQPTHSFNMSFFNRVTALFHSHAAYQLLSDEDNCTLPLDPIQGIWEPVNTSSRIEGHILHFRSRITPGDLIWLRGLGTGHVISIRPTDYRACTVLCVKFQRSEIESVYRFFWMPRKLAKVKTPSALTSHHY
jgi:hypothetical protein